VLARLWAEIQEDQLVVKFEVPPGSQTIKGTMIERGLDPEYPRLPFKSGR